MILGLVISLGLCSVGLTFDQDALNSRKALLSYGKMALKEKPSAVVEDEGSTKEVATKAIVTHETVTTGRDLGKADTSHQNSKHSLMHW